MDAYDQRTLTRLMKNSIKTESGCWEWQGGMDKDDYGKTKYLGSTISTHRLSYMLLRPDKYQRGLCVLHKCNNKKCLNPEHLYAGTNAENTRDSVISGTHFCAAKTHCKYGHEYTPMNTHRYKGKRYCLKCKKQYDKGRIR